MIKLSVGIHQGCSLIKMDTAEHFRNLRYLRQIKAPWKLCALRSSIVCHTFLATNPPIHLHNFACIYSMSKLHLFNVKVANHIFLIWSEANCIKRRKHRQFLLIYFKLITNFKLHKSILSYLINSFGTF